MKPELVKMIESPNTDRKVVLKLKHIDVKFNVRGRTLNAIRDVSLEIFDKETIAIVGESGSGKSVLTKTFAGMLDSNGYISHGNVYFSDDELSETNVALNKKNRYIRDWVLRKLNTYTHGKAAIEEYLALKALNEEDMKKKTLSPEEMEVYDKKLKVNDDQINETINVLFSLNKKLDKEQFKETKAQLKGLKAERKRLWNEKKNASKNKLKEYKNDQEYLASYKARKEELEAIRYRKYEDDKKIDLSEELKARNTQIADEVILSIGRYPMHKKVQFTRQLLARFKDFIWSGKDISTTKQLNRVFDPVVFRVERRGITTVEGNSDKVFINTKIVPQFGLEEVTDEDARNRTLVLQAKHSFPHLYKHLYRQLSKICTSHKGDKLNEKEERRVKDFVNMAMVYAANYDWYYKRARFAKRFIKWFSQATYSNGTDLVEKSKSKPVITLQGYAIVDCAKVKFTKDWQKIRGRKIATVFQDPMTSLNPILPIGKQIMIVIQKHQKCSQFEAKRRAIDIMAKVGITDPEKRFYDYPFQYSGGMRQRIVIAIALSCQPKILICDEPTTALDVTIQAQIIRLIKSLSKDLGFTTVYITHDLGVVANVAERVAVLYGGQIVELGTVEEIFYEPLHPYTWALLSSLPQLSQRGTELFSIPGTPPSLYNKIVGDAFAPRSQYALAIDFKKEPPMWKVSDTHFVKTWLLDPRAPKVEKPEAIQDLHKKMCKVYKDQI